MSYIRFGLMILTSTVVMFVLMYLNTYAMEHVFFSETRAYMALLMGATMAVIMLGYMLGMYRNWRLNLAILAGAVVVFGGMLWLVRGQATVSGPSYMRAMIPHHSIAIMTSERAQIRDARVRKLADEIIAAQRREIAEMRYLIAETTGGSIAEEVYHDPPARQGSVEDALAKTLVSQLDLAPLPEDEAAPLLGTAPRCSFHRSPVSDPVLWADTEGTAALKLNGVLVTLEAEDDPQDGPTTFSAPGITVTLRGLGEEADWRQSAELVFALDQGLTVGYRGFSDCTPT